MSPPGQRKGPEAPASTPAPEARSTNPAAAKPPKSEVNDTVPSPRRRRLLAEEVDTTPRSVAWPATHQPASDSQPRPNRAARRGKLPNAVATYSPAFGRLRYPRAIVRRCPTCGRGPSIHRIVNSAVGDGSIKTGSCGHRYRLRVRATLGVVA